VFAKKPKQQLLKLLDFVELPKQPIEDLLVILVQFPIQTTLWPNQLDHLVEIF